MGARTSKSANITSSPKKEPIVTEGENHVNGVGEAGPKDELIKETNNAVTEVIEVSRSNILYFSLSYRAPKSSDIENTAFLIP